MDLQSEGAEMMDRRKVQEFSGGRRTNESPRRSQGIWDRKVRIIQDAIVNWPSETAGSRGEYRNLSWQRNALAERAAAVLKQLDSIEEAK